MVWSEGESLDRDKVAESPWPPADRVGHGDPPPVRRWWLPWEQSPEPSPGPEAPADMEMAPSGPGTAPRLTDWPAPPSPFCVAQASQHTPQRTSLGPKAPFPLQKPLSIPGVLGRLEPIKLVGAVVTRPGEQPPQLCGLCPAAQKPVAAAGPCGGGSHRLRAAPLPQSSTGPGGRKQGRQGGGRVKPPPAPSLPLLRREPSPQQLRKAPWQPEVLLPPQWGLGGGPPLCTGLMLRLGPPAPLWYPGPGQVV